MSVKVRGRSLAVDIEKEIGAYNWYRPKWAGGKLNASSPFREEKRPSFAVCLESGVWVDSGSISEEWKKGNFIKLLAFLRNETYEESEDYLLDEYAPENWDVETLQLEMKLQPKEVSAPKFFPRSELDKFAYRHPYLNRRGLNDKTQNAVRIGYDPKTCAIVLPWFDFKGRLVSYKFRSVQDKRFWYVSGGQPIKNHLYGLHLVYRLKRFDTVYIVESEIDALTLWQSKRAAVAMGGATLTEAQKNLIIRAGIKKIVIATDNDPAGEASGRSIIKKLAGYVVLEKIVYPRERKDVNEFNVEELSTLQEIPVSTGFLRGFA